MYRSSTEYKYNALVTNAAELCWIRMGLRNFGIEMLLHKMGCHIRLNGYIIAKYFKLLNYFGKQHVHAKPIKFINKKKKRYYVCEHSVHKPKFFMNTL